jgi:hypothetical protein
MKTKQELKIFNATSIEVLKSLYYKSKTYLEKECIPSVVTLPIQIVSAPFRKVPIVKKSINKIENELKIFKNSSIETLKSKYYESIGIV